MRKYLPWCVVLGVGWAAVVVYSYPGLMSWDSVEQLAQARGLLTRTDWHPPIMPLIWHVLDVVVPGPLLMVLLQCGLMLGGMYALFARAMRPWRAVALALAVFLWPANFANMAVVWKDSLMAGLLLASTAALTSERAWPRRASLVGFLIATMLRHNALFAVAPLLVLLSPWPVRAGMWVRRAWGLGITAVLVVLALLGNGALVQERAHPFHNSVAVWDICATLRYAPPLSDGEIEELLAGISLPHHDHLQDRARTAFSPYSWYSAVRGDDRLMDPPTTDAQLDAVFHAWLRVIRTYPGAYLRARVRMFRELLGLQKIEKDTMFRVFGAFTEDTATLHSYGIDTGAWPLRRTLSARLAVWSVHSLLFRAYPYALIALALLIAARRDRLLVSLLASGWCYELALIVVSPSCDFRYSHWLITCVLVTLPLHIASAIRGTRTAPRSPSAPA